MRNEKALRNSFFSSVFVFSALCSLTALAETKTIETESTYIIGNNENNVHAHRIAVQDAKRKALEIAGSSLEKQMQLSITELKAYASGIMETAITTDETRGTTRPEVYVKTRSTIDTDVLMMSIRRIQESEDLKEQLDASTRENEALKKERDTLVKRLKAQKKGTKTQELHKKIDRILAQEDANEEINRLWVDLAYRLSVGNENGQEISRDELDKSAIALERTLKINPRNQRARYLLAAVYQKKGDYQAAENEARLAIHHNPSNPLSHMKLGILLKERGNYQEALKEFHFVERLRPRNPLMLYYTGMTLRELKRCGLSVQYLQRFLKDNTTNRFAKKSENAHLAINECGGARGGHKKRAIYH